jgi:stress-induced morphogen
MVSREVILERLRQKFPTAQMDLVDSTGTQDHYELHITAEEFEGKSRVAQHQLVYAALGDLMKDAIHALALRTSAPSR